MYLTEKEKAILDGEQGEIKRKCLELLVSVGELYDAKKLIDIQSVHLSGANILAVGEAGLRFVENVACNGTQMIVQTTTNPKSMPPRDGHRVGLTRKQIRDQMRLTNAFKKMGAFVCSTCTPYLLGHVPRPGEHISWSESSAVIYANAVLGARTNREGGPTALASAVTGKTPLYGYHLDENRAGTLLVKVTKKLQGVTAYGTLGYYIGKYAESGVPVLEGVSPDVTGDDLKMLSAALASSGAVAHFHMIGITREAPTKHQAFNGLKPTRVLEYGEAEEQETSRSLLTQATSRDVEWVTIGCPHISITEFREIAHLLSGRKIHPDIIMWVNTSVPIMQYAKKLGYAQVIEAANVQIICEICPVHTSPAFAKERGIRTITTNSAKTAHYAYSKCGVLPQYGDLRRCVEAAVSGKWR